MIFNAGVLPKSVGLETAWSQICAELTSERYLRYKTEISGGGLYMG